MKSRYVRAATKSSKDLRDASNKETLQGGGSEESRKKAQRLGNKSSTRGKTARDVHFKLLTGKKPPN